MGQRQADRRGVRGALCYQRTGDGFVFLTAKKSWPEVTAWRFAEQLWRYDYVWPQILAAAAIAVLVIERKGLPWVWSLFTLLYLVPSLVLGRVGLARCANECFPPFVAAGALLERQARAVVALAFAAAVLGQAVCAYWVIHSSFVP